MKICEILLQKYDTIKNGPLSEIVPESKLEELLKDYKSIKRKCSLKNNNVCPLIECYKVAKKYNLKNYEGK